MCVQCRFSWLCKSHSMLSLESKRILSLILSLIVLCQQLPFVVSIITEKVSDGEISFLASIQTF